METVRATISATQIRISLALLNKAEECCLPVTAVTIMQSILPKQQNRTKAI